jgi:hypothetical protein
MNIEIKRVATHSNDSIYESIYLPALHWLQAEEGLWFVVCSWLMEVQLAGSDISFYFMSKVY